MIKKFLAALTAVTMLTAGISAVAAELNFSASVSPDGTVTVSGTGNPGYVSVEIFPADNEAGRVSAGGNLGVADTAVVGEDGKFNLEWKLPSTGSGSYKVVVGNTGVKTEEKDRTQTIYFASQGQIDDAVEDITEAAEASELEDILSNNKQILQISHLVDSAEYAKHKAFVWDYVYVAQGSNGFASYNAVGAAIEEAIAIAEVSNATAVNFIAAMEKYNAVLALDTYFEYDTKEKKYIETATYTKYKSAMASCVASVVSEYLKEKNVTHVSTVDELKTVLRRVEAVAAVNTALRGEVISVIDDYSDIFGKDISTLNTNKAQQMAIQICVTEAAKAYTTVAAVKSAYDSAYSGSSSGSGSAGGGGGGGGGGGITTGGATGGSGVYPGGNGGVFGPKVEAAEEEATVAGPADLFNDLDSVEWAKLYINSLAQIGVVNGKAEGVFDPEAPVTREEFTKMLVEGAKLEKTEDAEAEITFTDVDSNAWYAPYIDTISSLGLIVGYEDGSFGIGKAITREEAVVLIQRAATYLGCEIKGDAELSFADLADISEFAIDGVKACYELKIVQGNDQNQFLPKNSITRAECAKIIYCLMEVL